MIAQVHGTHRINTREHRSKLMCKGTVKTRCSCNIMGVGWGWIILLLLLYYYTSTKQLLPCYDSVRTLLDSNYHGITRVCFRLPNAASLHKLTCVHSSQLSLLHYHTHSFDCIVRKKPTVERHLLANHKTQTDRQTHACVWKCACVIVRVMCAHLVSCR